MDWLASTMGCRCLRRQRSFYSSRHCPPLTDHVSDLFNTINTLTSRHKYRNGYRYTVHNMYIYMEIYRHANTVHDTLPFLVPWLWPATHRNAFAALDCAAALIPDHCRSTVVGWNLISRLNVVAVMLRWPARLALSQSNPGECTHETPFSVGTHCIAMSTVKIKWNRLNVNGFQRRSGTYRILVFF